MGRSSITWLTTDNHLFHERMIEGCGRPADFTSRIFSKLRYFIAPYDKLINLGDVIFHELGSLKELMDSVKCKTKILVMGNHDKESPSWYENRGFDYACHGLLIKDIWLSHKPAPVLPHGARLNIHGHWHNCQPTLLDKIEDWYDPNKYRLLAQEFVGYCPVNMEKFVNGDPVPYVLDGKILYYAGRGPNGSLTGKGQTALPTVARRDPTIFDLAMVSESK